MIARRNSKAWVAFRLTMPHVERSENQKFLMSKSGSTLKQYSSRTTFDRCTFRTALNSPYKTLLNDPISRKTHHFKHKLQHSQVCVGSGTKLRNHTIPVLPLCELP